MNQLMTKNLLPPWTPIAVVRLDILEHVVPMTRALARGGITRIEMTLTSPGAFEAISRVQQELQGEVVIGAGTVLDRDRIMLPTVSTVVPGLRGEMIRGRLGGAERAG